MNYKLTYTDKFVETTAKIIKKYPPIKSKIYKTLELLEANPHHSSLRLHKLNGSLKEFYSISISLNYRIVLELFIIDKEIILINIGKHSDIY